jgi:hypothetical protein
LSSRLLVLLFRLLIHSCFSRTSLVPLVYCLWFQSLLTQISINLASGLSKSGLSKSGLNKSCLWSQ